MGWLGIRIYKLAWLSDWFRKDPRVLHVDILEALFYDEEVYYLYHVCGPKCKNLDKTVGVEYKDCGCGLRVWSIRLTTFTTAAEEHDLKPTSFSMEEEAQAIFMSPVPNLRFNDSVAGVDRKRLEKARQIFKTFPKRHVDEKGSELAEVMVYPNCSSS